MKIQIVIPLTIFCSSIGAIFYILLKKFPVLAKISKDELLIDETFLNFIARKIKVVFSSLYALLNYKKHTFKTLVFLEKLLRKIKVAFLKFENRINSLIHIVRNKHKKIAINNGIGAVAAQSAEPASVEPAQQPKQAQSQNEKKMDL